MSDLNKEIKTARNSLLGLCSLMAMFTPFVVMIWVFGLKGKIDHSLGAGIFAIIVVSFIYCMYISVFIGEFRDYIRLRFNRYKEVLFQDFVSRVMEGIKQRELENAIQDTEEKLENIGVTIDKE